MRFKILLGLVMIFAIAACTKQIKETAPIKVEAKAEPEPAPPGEDETNPFFAEWETPFGVPPFAQIEDKHYMPAVQKGIEAHNAEIAAIVDNTEAPTFENTLAAMDLSGELLSKVLPVFFSMNETDTSDELMKIAEEMMPILTKHQDDILLNEKLFARIKAVYDKRDSLKLSVEEKTLLEESYKGFVRGGANLSEADKAKLRKVNEELAMLSLKFDDNILKENNKFELVIKNADDLAGLPDRVVAGAAETARRKGYKGKWVFTLDKPSLIPFLQYSGKRDLREKMFKGYIERGDHDDELDNKKIVARIAELRIQQANLLGYKTFADFVLDDRMAKTPAAVYGLLDEVWKPALKTAKREAKALQKMIKKDKQKFKLEPWDWWYYTEKLRTQKYDLDENEIRPYFKLENVRSAAFDLASKLYRIKFIERNDIPKYNPEATVFEVVEENGDHIGVLYVDYFPRESKRGGAWCGGFRDQYYKDGKRVAPIVTNVGNFSKPTADKPSLLSYEEVTTLFHEFGHALHSLFSDVQYSDSGGNVKTDFVELPSQIMENWAGDPEYLKMYARHFETNEPIPDKLIKKIRKSRNFNEGFATAEYTAACYLDMDWHVLTEPTKDDVRTFEKKALEKIGLIPEIVVRYKSPYFAHIFSGDYYAAGYYSYLWSEVLDADAFNAFKEKGLFDRETAKSFRDNILSKGGSEDPMTLYVRFRGAEPSTKPMLKRKGFI